MLDVGAPIFVLAPTGRSGTNLLSHLLSAHPLVGRSPVPEDYIAERASLLVDYSETLVGRWEKFFEPGRLHQKNYTPDHLLARFGEALLNFIGNVEPDRHMVLKTPALFDLPNLQRLFPTGQMVILIRDPRSIAESLVRSNFGPGLSLEDVGCRWATSMRRFEGWLNQANPALDRERVHLIRFEELAHAPANEYAKLLEALGLPPDADAIAYAADPPVIGSSFNQEEHTELGSRNRPNFTPQPRPQGFDPTCRWSHWSMQTHSRFNRTCGTIMNRWGYTPIRRKTPNQAYNPND